MRFVWRNLPVFFIWLVGLSMLNNSLHHISPPIQSVRMLSLFPLGVTVGLLWYACRNEYGSDGMIRPFFAWAFGVTAVYFTPFMHGLVLPLDMKTQRLIYEFSALSQFAILLVHSRTWFVRWDWVWVFGVTLLFGFALENGGIFLGVFSEPGYLFYLPWLPAPLATALGWASVLYCAFFAVEKLLPSMPSVKRGLVCALIGLSLDLTVDPVATRLGWWVWETSLEAKIWEVPAINFIAWFWALFPYAALYYWVRGTEKYGEGRKAAYFVAGFPAILLGEFVCVIATLALAGDRASLLVIERFFSSLGLS